MVTANIAIISSLKQFIFDVSSNSISRCRYVERASDFSRRRVLTLERVVGLLLNMPKRSLSVEVREFFDHLSCGKKCNKSAFSMQRSKLRPLFFQDLLSVFVDNFYHHYGDKVKRWRGFLIQAVDGSTAYLINNEEIIDYFGTQDNQHVHIPMAQVMQIQDVLNDITVWGDIYPIKTSEQSIIAQNRFRLQQNSITLFDRGYPSYSLIYLLQQQNALFVMRAKESFNQEVKNFMASFQQDIITYFSPGRNSKKTLSEHGYTITTKTKIKVRLVKVLLSTGETEVLITNLFDQQLYSINDLGYLYSLRWGIETCFGKQKNQLQLEIFSGHRVLCVLQDFYASLFVANLQCLIEKQSDGYLVAISKQRKYRYKINRNISWAVLKNTLFKLFLTHQDPQLILKRIQQLFEECLEPVRPNRKARRVKKTKRINGKYQTFNNYKRAI